MASLLGSRLGLGTRRAATKTNTVFDDIISPLLSKEVDGTVATSVCSDSSSARITAKPNASQALTAALVAAVVVAGAGASILSFILYPAIAVYVAGGVCLFNCPVVLYNQKRMIVLPTLRHSVNELRRTAELLDNSIEVTQKEIDDLKSVASGFNGVEGELSELATRQNVSVDKLVELVRENEHILNSMRENLRQRIIQDVIGTAVRTCGDKDQQIDRVETKLLALKIKVKLEVYGIYFDEDKFLQAIALRPTFYGAIAVVKKLLPCEYQQEAETKLCSALFTDDESLDEDDLYDMFYMSREEQEQRGSVLAVRAIFGDGSSARKISLAKSTVSSGSGARSALKRSRLTSTDVISGGGLFALQEEA